VGGSLVATHCYGATCVAMISGIFFLAAPSLVIACFDLLYKIIAVQRFSLSNNSRVLLCGS
jgi:hypothetical protein